MEYGKILLRAIYCTLIIASCNTQPPKEAKPVAQAVGYDQPLRPQYHFSPQEHWINDPNGLTYHNGEYHLFYQYNPFGVQWGHMSWGHAVSTDLVHWTHLPVALKEENNVMIFSGSAVSDVDNTSGFGTGENPPMVAIYTGHHTDKKLQEQHIAYSLDNGRTWTKYEGNPVINIAKENFRDPKVFWHKTTEKWIMAVALPVDKKVQFYGSKNLKNWDFLSEFGPAAATDGIWECPDLFELPVEGTDGETRWVLQVDLNPGSVAGGSGGQYFIGNFDGTTFTSEIPEASPDAQPLWVDYGKDFYAAQSWSNIPEEDERRLWLAWMNNWQYANDIPTGPWRGSMTIPRSVTLKTFPEGIRLVQQPVEELKALRKKPIAISYLSVSDSGKPINLDKYGIGGKKLEITATFDIGNASQFGFKVRKGEIQETIVGYSTENAELFVDRNKSGKVSFDEDFPGKHPAPLKPVNGKIKLHIFIDHSSVEVFANEGKVVISDRIFPDPVSDQVEIFSIGGNVKIDSLTAWPLKSAWKSKPG